jgi:hypothetical protein
MLLCPAFKGAVQGSPGTRSQVHVPLQPTVVYAQLAQQRRHYQQLWPRHVRYLLAEVRGHISPIREPPTHAIPQVINTVHLTLYSYISKNNVRFIIFSAYSYNVKEEFTCPLCETVGNTVLPIYPDFRELNTKNSSAAIPALASASSTTVAALSYEDWLDGLEKTLDQSVKRDLQEGSSSNSSLIINPCRLSTITKLMADAVAYNFKSLFEFDSFTHLASSLPSSNKSTANLGMDFNFL